MGLAKHWCSSSRTGTGMVPAAPADAVPSADDAAGVADVEEHAGGDDDDKEPNRQKFIRKSTR